MFFIQQASDSRDRLNATNFALHFVYAALILSNEVFGNICQWLRSAIIWSIPVPADEALHDFTCTTCLTILFVLVASFYGCCFTLICILLLKVGAMNGQ